jgi:hypothetical protein
MLASGCSTARGCNRDSPGTRQSADHRP